VSVTIPRSLALLGVLALVACGAPPGQSTPPTVEVRATANASASQAPLGPVLHWAPCGDDFPGTECTSALVPLDYDQPRGAKTTIALARIPASDQSHRIGSLFINPGGPGGSGVDIILYNFEWSNNLAALLHGRFDVIGFDPRGVARSEPLYCFDTSDEENAWIVPFPFFPWQKDQERWVFDEWRYFAGQCLGHKQRILPHMSTANVARDLDLLRKAVGDERLTYLGFSYGTYIGETYANLFPDTVRAMVIDGVIDPRVWSSGPYTIYDRVAGDKEFKEYLRLCDAAGHDDAGNYYCSLSGPEGAAARWNALAEKIRSAPFSPGFVFPDGSTMSYDLLIYFAYSSLYNPAYWVGPDNYTDFFAALADLALGDSTAGMRAAELRRAIQARLAEPAGKQEQYANGYDAMAGYICGDTEFPRPFAAWSIFGDFAAYHSTFGPLMLWWVGPACATWPAASDRYVGPWEVRTSAPVLVVGNYFDGVTDYGGAVATSKLLRNSRLLSYAGWGHTAYGQSSATPCVTDHIVNYLYDGTLPPKGTVCPAPPNPFLPTAALRSAAPATRPVVRPPPWLLRRW